MLDGIVDPSYPLPPTVMNRSPALTVEEEAEVPLDFSPTTADPTASLENFSILIPAIAEVCITSKSEEGLDVPTPIRPLEITNVDPPTEKAFDCIVTLDVTVYAEVIADRFCKDVISELVPLAAAPKLLRAPEAVDDPVPPIVTETVPPERNATEEESTLKVFPDFNNPGPAMIVPAPLN